MKHRDVFFHLEEMAPLETEESWDRSGFMLGNLEDETRGVLVTLDLTEETLESAIRTGANLIVTHHPVFFEPALSIDRGTPRGALIARALKEDITVLSWHTNYDKAEGGVNDILAKKFALREVEKMGEEGLGRIGIIEEVTAEAFAEVVKDALALPEVTLYGDLERRVRRVGVVGGSGMDFALSARESGADVFVTGDVRYHQAMDALERGLVVIDATHDGTENPAMEALAERLRAHFPLPVFYEPVTIVRHVR